MCWSLFLLFLCLKESREILKCINAQLIYMFKFKSNHYKRCNQHWLAKQKEASVQFSSVQFSHLVVSNSLRPHGLQHARLASPSSTPGAYSNSCLLSQWCHPTISSSVVPFSSRLQYFPASGSFQMSQLFISGGQSIGVSASADLFLSLLFCFWF